MPFTKGRDNETINKVNYSVHII